MLTFLINAASHDMELSKHLRDCLNVPSATCMSLQAIRL